MKHIEEFNLQSFIGKDITSFSVEKNQISIFFDGGAHITTFLYEEFISINSFYGENSIINIINNIVGIKIYNIAFEKNNMVLFLSNGFRVVFACDDLPFESYIIFDGTRRIVV
ncbi:hypothetical protein [Sphingopyxis kveilinensis]|uniref:hypothetical protein n=1 Tax=Sphingopyxis kveilinensis TaxID=3114367 RepID=UPI0030D52CC3